MYVVRDVHVYVCMFTYVLAKVWVFVWRSKVGDRCVFPSLLTLHSEAGLLWGLSVLLLPRTGIPGELLCLPIWLLVSRDLIVVLMPTWQVLPLLSAPPSHLNSIDCHEICVQWRPYNKQIPPLSAGSPHNQSPHSFNSLATGHTILRT